MITRFKQFIFDLTDKGEKMLTDKQRNDLNRYYESRGLTYKYTKERLTYSIDLTVIDRMKTLIFIIISYGLERHFTGIFWSTVLSFATVEAVKRYAFGAHMKSSICSVYGLCITYGSYFIGFYTDIPDNVFLIIKCVIFLLCFILFYRHSPGPSKKQRIQLKYVPELKRKSLYALVLLFFLSFAPPPEYQVVLCFTVLFQAIKVWPVFYKIFGEDWIGYEK